MRMHLVYTAMMIVFLLTVFAYASQNSYSNDITLTKLTNVPDNAIAACKVKSNDFAFLCVLNKKNYYNCKFAIGSKFTLPECKPVPCTKCDCEPKKEPVKAPANNTFLDAFKKATDKKEPEPVKPKQSNPFLDAINKLNAQKY